LQPAIDLCDKGFPINVISSHGWSGGKQQLLSGICVFFFFCFVSCCVLIFFFFFPHLLFGLLFILIIGPNSDELLMPDGSTPKLGQIFKNKNLAGLLGILFIFFFFFFFCLLIYRVDTFRSIISHGKDGFYQGKIASEIVHLVQNFGK
jgi:gamma-glutamyltranspeptidase